MKITILTVGSRGDVQPYLALGVGLLQQGHQVQVITAKNFGAWVQQLGLQFAPLDMDILQMMENPEARAALAGKNPFGLMQKVMPVLRQALSDSWRAAQAFGPEVIVHHPKTLSGYHLADKLGCALYLALPLPLFSPTSAFPSPILPLGSVGPLNKITHQLLLSVTYAPYRQMINDWRKSELGLPPAKDELTLRGQPVTRLYPYSTHVLPRPADWDASVQVTGYWWLARDPQWQPSAALADFLRAGSAPVYIGFGSMAGMDPERTTRTVLAALKATEQRAVLASGWGGLQAQTLPPNLLMLDAAPHDWLFPQMAAVVHHGGAGTTGMGLWAGKPTLVCPFFGDQPFWGRQVFTLGAGPKPIAQKQLTVENLTQALTQLTNDAALRQRAEALGQKIRAEDGVAQAIRIITHPAFSGVSPPAKN